ncbi:MAG TPA: beta-ketoacyl-ACP synthase II [Chloroflexota bacterium]|nr:beta-ketoacyl-ACP synthase II [Chloroflexota bacterium]
MSERDFSAQTAVPAGQQRVVVTGVGAVTPLGTDAPATWTALLEGRCGIGPIGAFDASGFSTRIAAEVRDFDPQAACDLSPKDARRLDRFVLLGLAAAREAVADAGLPLPLPDGDRCGVYVGSGMGGLVTLSEQFDVLRRRGPDRVSPFLVPMMICDMASGQISISLGARGPNMAIVSACATGAHAIGEATAAIRAGRADVILAGGAEAVITAIGIAGFAAARALSTRNDAPQRASRPFDRERDGFVMGEGAAVVVLEREDLARRRGARIYAEVAGYGASADAYHLTAPPESGEGAVRCMRQALAGAGLDPSELDYLNAHGTSTPLNDRAETAAIKAALGAAAGRLAISSTKGAMGHLLGAAGSVEAVVAIKAIECGIVPPTLNYEHPDPDCDLDYTPNRARRLAVRTAMTNSFGFGGHNAALLFRAVEDGRRAA